jgi:hypothetical protein
MIQVHGEEPEMAKKKAEAEKVSAGRKSLYGEPLKAYFTVRVNEEQGAALGEWCTKHQVSPAALLREVGLLRAGVASLGIGVKALKGKAEKEITLSGAACFPVKCTVRQAEAIETYAERKKIPPSTFLKEVGLEYIGAARLGALGAVKEAERVSRVISRR